MKNIISLLVIMVSVTVIVLNLNSDVLPPEYGALNSATLLFVSTLCVIASLLTFFPKKKNK